MSMFSIGLSGLNAAQNALNTTSNNISNVYTTGYNREITILGEQSSGSPGVQVNDIQRQFNKYVASQLNNARTQSTALEKYSQQITQIDSLLADRDAGLSPLMQTFFSSLEDLASAPSDPAARQGVIGTAQTLSAQFRSFDSYLQDMQNNINSEIEDEITQVNNTTQQIAGLNREIALSRARSGEAPNSLLNQRDQMIAELNERLNVRLNIQDGKTYNVSLPNGQPLVSGADAFKLTPITAENDPQRTIVGYRDGSGNVVPLDEDVLTGGSLGGLMRFRQESLDKTQNQIGQLAVSLTTAFNEIHKQGIDLDGEQGKNFFSIRAPQAYSGKNNSAEVSTITFDATRVDDLRATDYQVKYDGSSFSVTRQDSGEEVNAEWDGTTLSFGGIDMTLSGAPAAGDTFNVQPVRRAAAGMDVLVSDLDKIAAAQGPVSPMPYSTVDFQSQSTTRLGQTESFASKFATGSTLTGETSGIKPFAFIPVDAKNVEIHLYDLGADDDIQIFTRDGKHLIGTPVTGSDADYTWTSNSIDSEDDLETQVFTLARGFPEGTTYSDEELLFHKGTNFSSDLADGVTSSYNGMTFTYTGDADHFDSEGAINDGSSSLDGMSEKLNIDTVTEPLFVLISANGRFNITATWDDMPGVPAAGGAISDNTPIGRVQNQLEVSEIDVAPAFKQMDAKYQPPSFAIKAADDGALTLGLFGAESDNNLFVSPDAGSVPTSPPPEGIYSIFKEDGTEIDNVLSVNAGTGDTLAAGERLIIKDDATGATILSFTVDELPSNGTTSGVAFTGITGTTGPGDNRNALALQDLQNELTVGGSASFSGAYGAIVSDVGNQTNIAQVNLDARQGLTDQLRAVQQSESGVNLDEEAANLIRFQQFYQANARVISTASTIFDTILGLRS
ncbi:flagellar hook-associated protein FlgK [Vreelandella lionensis]|uniref:flagellar hook-associated protein FlgK n=1 Tax=Vreelandella lionensis TaxID=1144478 RepID=UPI001FB56632|nr:flagellar hook-associated protein FlgK [Halomonas lionensis]